MKAGEPFRWSGRGNHMTLGSSEFWRGFRRLAVFTGFLGFLSFAFLFLVYRSDWMLSWFGWNVYWNEQQYDFVYAAVDVCVIGLLFVMLPALITLAAGWLILFAAWVVEGFRPR